jgi:hypothetical protein
LTKALKRLTEDFDDFSFEAFAAAFFVEAFFVAMRLPPFVARVFKERTQSIENF